LLLDRVVVRLAAMDAADAEDVTQSGVAAGEDAQPIEAGQ